MRTHAWLAALLPVICSCTTPPQRGSWTPPRLSAEQPGTATAFRFAWPIPGSVRVVERIDRRGERATVTYDFRLTQGDNPRELLARIENYTFLQINGADAQQLPPQERARIEAAIASIPAMRIARDGTFLGLHDLAGFLDRMEELQGSQPALREMMAQPAGRMAFERQVSRFWRAWVECWSGMVATPGELRELPRSADVLARLGVPAGSSPTARRTFHGLVATPADHAHVAFSLRYDMQPGALQQFLRALRAPEQDLADVAGTAAQTMEALLDPATLRPAAARWEEVLEVSAAGVRHLGVERHEYSFTWQ